MWYTFQNIVIWFILIVIVVQGYDTEQKEIHVPVLNTVDRYYQQRTKKNSFQCPVRKQKYQEHGIT
jgi:hypothetical protein